MPPNDFSIAFSLVGSKQFNLIFDSFVFLKTQETILIISSVHTNRTYQSQALCLLFKTKFTVDFSMRPNKAGSTLALKTYVQIGVLHIVANRVVKDGFFGCFVS
jgi:hypothetical protein